MSLKFLMIPSSILITFAIMIGFIRPDIATLQEKKSAHVAMLAKEENMDTLLSNIDALTASLDSEWETERFVIEYLPKQMDQGRVIDIFNYLAAQSGVAVIIMALAEVIDETSDRVTDVDSVKPAGLTNATGAPVAPPVASYTVRPKTFSARVLVNGQYENIKEFLQRLAHMNRMHKTQNFSIEKQEKAGGADADQAESGILVGSFEAHFDFFDAHTGYNALSTPIFSKGVFDMSPFEKISRWVTEDVPLLEKPTTGRPNPFQ